VVFVASRQLENYSATRHGQLGREAAAVLVAGGRPALERWLRTEARIPPRVNVYVFDEDGNDILGRRPPGELREFIRKSVVGVTTPETVSYRPVRLAPQLVGPDGARYAFLVLPSGIGIFGNLPIALGLLVAALLVIAVVAWFIARTVGRPIGELQAAARELSLGHIDARVPATIAARRDELGTLAADFNLMAEKLSALLASRQQLLSELSHELRSPLARLQAALALVTPGHELAPRDRLRIEAEIRRMDQVIGDLLRFTRLDAAATLTRRLVRIDELLRELIAVEEVEAQARACRLRLSADRNLGVVGDPELLRSGFENILRNAIRYSSSGGEVELTATHEGEDVRVKIADRGPGVPEEQLQKIFEPYVRFARHATDTGGTGLGLAIARRVFQVHEGRIRATNREGGGLVVTVELPAATAA
jgi:signal transduction histidine kinase